MTWELSRHESYMKFRSGLSDDAVTGNLFSLAVVIDSRGRLVFVDLRFVQSYETAGPYVHDVVSKNIVRHVPLHVELTGACFRRIVPSRSHIGRSYQGGVGEQGLGTDLQGS